MLQALTGVRYDAVEQTLYVDAKVGNFTTFLSTEYGFGTVTFRDGKAELEVAFGEIPLRETVIL